MKNQLFSTILTDNGEIWQEPEFYTFAWMASFTLSNFENESAEIFISEVVTNGYGLIRITIERIMERDIEPTLLECEEALIAAELVAAAGGHAAHDLPDEAREWIDINLPQGSEEQQEIAGLKELAADAIDRIVADSELREFWDEHPEFNEWLEAQVELQERLLE